MGAQVALLAATRDPRLQCVAAIGTPVRDEPYDPADFPASRPDPDELAARSAAVDITTRLHQLTGRDLLFGHGDADEHTRVEVIDRLVFRLAREHAPRSLSLLRYAGAHHTPNDWLDIVDAWMIARLTNPSAPAAT